MHGFVAAGGPAGSAGEEGSVIAPADLNSSRSRLLLKMALETKILVALNQHPRIDRSVNRMAGGAAFTNRLMLEDEGASLGGVAPAAGFELRGQGRTAAFYHRTLVRIVAIAATDFSFQHRMMVRQIEFTPFVQMTLEAGLWRFARIDDRVMGTAGFGVEAAGPVARFAADVDGVVTRRFQFGMGRGGKALRDILVALSAIFRAHVACPGNLRWNHGDAVNTDAGDKYRGQEQAAKYSEKFRSGHADPSTARCVPLRVGFGFHRFWSILPMGTKVTR